MEFLPNPEPDQFHDKLSKLLKFLHEDEIGVKKLVEMGNDHIQVATDFHNGNTLLGGFHMNKDTIRMMSALNLGIDFDLYATGKYFK